MRQVIADDISREAPRGLFGAILAVSLTLHLGVIALLPGVDRGDRPTPARPLEVVLAEQPIEPKRRRLPDPPPPAPVARERAQPRPTPPPPRTASPAREILAMQAESAPSSLTVSAPAPQERLAKPEAAPPAPAPVVAAPALVPARESVTPATHNAAYLRNPRPDYPVSARRAGITGVVELKVRVTPDGRAGEVQVQSSSGSSVLDGAALETVRKWLFVPGRTGQTPVESWIVVPIVFQLEKAR